MPDRVVVAMSGGVDSSVAAALLHEEGYDVIGITMKLWDGPESGELSRKTCCTLDDVSDARRVAEQLGIPFFVVNFKSQFETHVIDYFTASYQRGETPNPCVQCNRYLKFTHLRHRAQQLGANWVATGHYASVTAADGRFYLQRGRDAGKDQSYFLFDLTQEQLAQTLLPLGRYRKEEVREMATRWQLNVAQKAESQEICFIPDGDYRAFLRTRLETDETVLGAGRGPMVTTRGEVVGEHRGLPLYTVGQRRGLGISAGEPLYVTELQMGENTLVVGSRQDAMAEMCWVEQLNWMCLPPAHDLRTTVQIRYRHQPIDATIQLVADDRVRVVFREPQFAVTPGQAAVFYEGDQVIGGGWISRSTTLSPNGNDELDRAEI